MLLSMDLLQDIQVGCCWLPTHPSLDVVGVVYSRQLLQLGAGDRLLVVLRLQASLDVGDILRLQQALPMLPVRKDGAQAAADEPSQLKSKNCTWSMQLPGGLSQHSQKSSSQDDA